MNKLPFLFFVLFLTGCALFPNSAKVPATDSYVIMSPIVDSAETFFISLKKKKYGTAWDLLSAESHNRIINDEYKARRKNGENIQKVAIQSDFETGGVLFNLYWDDVLKVFDPDMVLEKSRWEMGSISKDEAEIIILYKKSEHPAILKMFKENEAWKVGLVESFWTRKL